IAYGDSVNQTIADFTIQEGESVLLPCSYTSSFSPVIFWYVQHPPEPPRHLLSSYDDPSEETKKNGFSAVLDKKESFHLKKASGEPRDSAVYFCALRDTVKRMTSQGAQKPTQWLSEEHVLEKALLGAH
ncbi:T-cell receptor alpha chain V region RL-5, partial [Podarcis lilfordi]